MLEELQRRNYSQTTVKSYLQIVAVQAQQDAQQESVQVQGTGDPLRCQRLFHQRLPCIIQVLQNIGNNCADSGGFGLYRPHGFTIS